MAVRERLWTIALVAAALVLPVGSLLQPRLFPSRSAMPIIRPGLNAVTILVTVPGLRSDRVHHLGYARETTPVLDEMAFEGVSFRRAYAASNDPRLTLAAICAGVLPANVGMQASGDTLPPDASTLAERIRRDGGRTVCVRADPAQLGMGLEQGFDEVVDLPPAAPADELFEHALQSLFEPRSGPLFVWIDLPDLRWPYGGPDFDAAAQAPQLAPAVPRGYGDECASRASVAPGVGIDADADEACLGSLDPEWLGQRYDAALHRLDAALGRFLDALAARMRLETASLCIAGTSGAPLADRADRMAGEAVDLYEPSVHVPLVFRLASRAVRGRVLDEFANSVDIGPTLLKLTLKAGATSEWRGGCGRSLLTTMTDRRDTNSLALSQGRHRSHGAAEDAPALAVWADRLKLIAPLGASAGYELYDVLADPDESAPSVRRNDIVAGALLKKARAWQADCKDR